MTLTFEQYYMDTHFEYCTNYNEVGWHQYTCICNISSRVGVIDKASYAWQAGCSQAQEAYMQSGITLCQDCINKRNQPRCADCGRVI